MKKQKPHPGPEFRLKMTKNRLKKELFVVVHGNNIIPFEAFTAMNETFAIYYCNFM